VGRRGEKETIRQGARYDILTAVFLKIQDYLNFELYIFDLTI
jgi:hypothetical protein